MRVSKRSLDLRSVVFRERSAASRLCSLFATILDLEESAPSPHERGRHARARLLCALGDERIERLCEAATAGPWRAFVEGRDCAAGSSFIRTAGADIELAGATDADFDFIAEARQIVPRLIAELRRLRTGSGSGR